MKAADDDGFLADLARSDPWVQRITPARIGAALVGFDLPFEPGWNIDRLSHEIQGVAHTGRSDPPQGEAEAIGELSELAAAARRLQNRINRMGDTAQLAVLWEVMKRIEAAGGGGGVDWNKDVKPLMVDPLETIANILSRAASQLSTRRAQTTRWRGKHGQERRVVFAVYLTPIFESAFNTPARANNWRQEYGEGHPWPDFFRRIHLELFPDVKRLNLSKVLQQAQREMPLIETMAHWLDEQDAIRAEKNRDNVLEAGPACPIHGLPQRPGNHAFV